MLGISSKFRKQKGVRRAIGDTHFRTLCTGISIGDEETRESIGLPSNAIALWRLVNGLISDKIHVLM